MKKIIIIIISLFVSFQFGYAQKHKGITVPTKLTVYYFHATNRCATCNSIEQNAKNVLQTSFKNEQAQGAIKMVVLNVDDKINEKICEKYKIAGSSLLLVKTANGKEVVNDMTNYAFSYSRNQPDKFKAELKSKILASLK